MGGTNVCKQGKGISFLIFRCSLLGFPKPRTGRFASSRTHLPVTLYTSPLASLVMPIFCGGFVGKRIRTNQSTPRNARIFRFVLIMPQNSSKFNAMQGVKSPDFMRVQYIMLCETLRFFRGICNKFATPYFLLSISRMKEIRCCFPCPPTPSYKPYIESFPPQPMKL